MPEKILSYPGALTGMVRRVALAAGAATLTHFNECGYVGARGKADGSPVTTADQEAEDIITASLRAIVPNIPIVAEEAVAAGRIPNMTYAPYFWLVDPLDGTKEFIAGSPDYTVNIALIKEGKPLLGVVYAPALGILYAGHGAGTAIRWREDSGEEKALHARHPPKEGLTVMISRSHARHQDLEAFLAGYKVAKVIQQGSSLKLCAIAEGRADMYPRLGPTSQWDIAAGEAVLRAAGGQIVELNGGSPLPYGGHTAQDFLNSAFVATGL